MNTALIVDSTVSAPEPDLCKYDFFRIVPHSIITDDRIIPDTVESARTTYIELIKNANSIRPKTSQPNPTQFLTTIANLVGNGFQNIIILTLTTRTSGTYKSAE